MIRTDVPAPSSPVRLLAIPVEFDPLGGHGVELIASLITISGAVYAASTKREKRDTSDETSSFGKEKEKNSRFPYRDFSTKAPSLSLCSQLTPRWPSRRSGRNSRRVIRALHGPISDWIGLLEDIAFDWRRWKSRFHL